jgi:uncharacterized protein (DUF58 family)
VLVFIFAFIFPVIFQFAVFLTFLFLAITVLDVLLLFFIKGQITGYRIISPRFSLGDDNKIIASIANFYPYRLSLRVQEQLPVQFQERNFTRNLTIPYGKRDSFTYWLKPQTRGEYHFGELIGYVSSPIGLMQRKHILDQERTIKVYPSYHQLKKYQLLATTENLFSGAKKIRKLGHSLEFEKIKTYVQGDDIRTINWKATARSGDLMVNTYVDAREQQVYVIVDKGRAMKMPFEGMTLLDYAINSSLSFVNVVLLKHDKAGLITFSNKIGNIIPAEKRSAQLHQIIEALYKQQTDFKESDYETLLGNILRRVTQRSFFLLFTNFETLSSLDRQLPYLKRLAARHLLCVVFFQNTLLKEIHETQPDTTEGIYIKTIADRFDFEKKQIVKELRRNGILSILTTPQQLTIDVINKYLELKAKQMV